MKHFMHGLLSMALNAPAWAANEPSNTNGTTWEIYGIVLAAFVVGAIWVVWYQKREEKRERQENHGENRSSNPA